MVNDANSKTLGRVEQVLDEIALTEGAHTEVTPSLVRAYWGAVHPKNPTPSRTVICDVLNKLTETGVLDCLVDGKSWTFKSTADTDQPVQTEVDEEWEELVPAPPPTKNVAAIAIRVNPFGKTPSIVFRFRRDFVTADRVRIFTGKNNKVAFKFTDKEGRRIGAYDKKSTTTRVTRIVGEQVDQFLSKFTGLRLPWTFSFDVDDIDVQGDLYIVKLEQE